MKSIKDYKDKFEHINKPMNELNHGDYEKTMIKTNMGEIPVADYLDMKAEELGYENYNEMKADGFYLEEEFSQ